MILSQHYLDCLSHASYLIGDETTGRAVVVDPQRDVSGYLAEAGEHGLRIELVIETHFHADFVSGHLELAAKTGAEIAYGSAADADYPIRRLADGERIELGDVVLEIVETPGHTPESIAVVVWECATDTAPHAVLTGDTLFIGDVGRPDLLAAAGLTPQSMAASLFHSLQRLLELPDSTRVLPAHGAGSACGRSLSTETSSTIGEQRRTNYALAPMTEDAFVALVTEGQSDAPAYFGFDADANRHAHALLDEDEATPSMTVDEVIDAVARHGAAILDTRDPADFATAHLVGSVNVGLGGRFAEYAGDVLAPDTPIVLVGDPGTERQSRVRLARIGFDNVVGHVADPQQAFLERPDLVRRASRLTATELAARRDARADLVVIDVRGRGERIGGAVDGALAIPLARLRERLAELDPTKPTVTYCAGGYRSSIAASTLRAAGFADVSDLIGGYDAWAARP
ncbi:MAG TPA: rhodanese-like domain-containing protein [Acidimicrobiales bacterium]